MIKITLPDGSAREYESGVTSIEIAKSISEGLARKVLAASVNGEIFDVTRPINIDATFKLLTWDDSEGKSTFWHSSAHLMAEAVQATFPHAKFWVGPALEKGFYYDIDLGDNKISEEDLTVLEKKMNEFAKQNNPYVRKSIPKAEAIQFFTDKGDEYKLDLLSNLNDGEISFYTQGSFTDLCRGPHIPSTGFIKAIKLTTIAGAYWKGNEKNKQLTRIYGVTFPNQKDLDEYLLMLEEAKKRDHRKLGKELGIFTMDDMVGQGLPLWLPNGGIVIEELEKLAKETESEAGYKRVVTPHIAKEEMYLTSGHLPYYADSMFPPMELDGTKYYLRAMNCPHHHKVFDAEPKSYKDLPFRIAEYGTCYRYEQSGELFGLMRVRSLQMNDAHIYCTKDQMPGELDSLLTFVLNLLRDYGLEDFYLELSTRNPAKSVGTDSDWEAATEALRSAAQKQNLELVLDPEGAAFYGPKISVQAKDAIGRTWQMSTIQVDFQLPARFGIEYQSTDGSRQEPVMIHRALFGSIERFFGVLTEHYAGAFPPWLAPVQVRGIPVADGFIPYLDDVAKEMRKAGIRVDIDKSDDRMQKKIRNAQVEKIPFMMIVGEEDQKNGAISFRYRNGDQKNGIAIKDAIAEVLETIKNRAQV